MNAWVMGMQRWVKATTREFIYDCGELSAGIVH